MQYRSMIPIVRHFRCKEEENVKLKLTGEITKEQSSLKIICNLLEIYIR